MQRTNYLSGISSLQLPESQFVNVNKSLFSHQVHGASEKSKVTFESVILFVIPICSILVWLKF